MSQGNRTGENFNTDMRRPQSVDLYGPSSKQEHTVGVSGLGKRTIEDAEEQEAQKETGPFTAKKQKMQWRIQPDQRGASSQQRNDTKGQNVDEMNIDSKEEESELDPKLMEATKTLGIKPASEVKADLDWAEIYSHGYWSSSEASNPRR